MLSGIDRVSFARKRTFGCITNPRQREALAAGQNLPHGHLILRQSSGFVGTNDGCAAQRFDRWKFANDCIAFCHFAHANGQSDRHGRWQAFGNRAHGQRYGCHEHVQPRFAADDANHKRRHSHSKNDVKHDAAKMCNLAGQRSSQYLSRRDQLRNAADFSVIARTDDNACRRSVRHKC